MGDRVLVVASEPERARALRSGLDEAAVAATVDAVTELEDLFDELCYGTVDCLVVPADCGPADGRDVERGVRALYPDLEIVLTGVSGDFDADGRPTRVVEAADLGAASVVAAVAAALDSDRDSAAGRPPSRLETLLMSAVDQFPVHLYAKDDAARHALATGATVPLPDVIGRTDLVLTDGAPEHHERTHSDDQRVIERGERLIETEEYTASDDDEYALTTKVPWYGPDGDIVGLVGITRDISERKAREGELRRQNERLTKVALVAAHELRNELQVASGRLEGLPEDTPHLDVVRESHARLASIVDDIVEMASRERARPEQQPVWLSTPAREVWEGYDAPGAEMVVEGDRRIVANPESLRILFEILLSNAVDHGGPDVTVTVRGTDDGFVVADDGPGIGVDPPDRVFDAGFAASEDSDGFGLYVAQRIATDHNWELRAENGPEGGARFVVGNVESPDD